MLRFLVFFFCLISVSSIAYSQSDDCNQHQCIAVIDAGSSGSRVHLYSYDLDETNTPTHIHEFWSKKIKPGFATIEPNKNSIDAYLTTLLSSAPVEDLPVYFYATAGMRLLPQSKQQQYYNELNRWFHQQSKWRLISAKTITGNEEALFGWLAVNYSVGALNSNSDSAIGVMDMGGASVQIVFPIQYNPKINKNYQIALELYGKRYTLFVHSFLGLGQNEMSHQFLNSASCFSDNYPLPDGETGQGDASSCELEISSLLNGVHKVNKQIQPLLNSNPVDRWYGIGGFTYFANSKVFEFDKTQLTNQSLITQADNQICHQQWDALSSKFPSEELLYEYCLLSSYYYALMVDGYGISSEQAINYLPQEQNLDWTIGVVLHPIQ
ncbi:multidrug DMT transporter permease [Legionella waltersii]|uniref:Ectonucleoside triphosphate diphosphohydrolase I n=1 Tax=Legionella waltersii TaxID=66969 RepID=A0A0W1AMC8_9GAMM|nr:multidrug DMT transporter permease [Legionella waltersii]KTD82509.1 ectonucleoside triphosphate diphosphohydrolase I [Legionella waltersii]SNV02963.1 ectonucleoside triphosphate diphosphohydrolase I [Legionella waltersii]